VDSSFITVEGFAYWEAARGLRPTAVLRVRLLDLKGTERGSVVAATSQPLPQAQRASAWMLRVPTAHRHVADDGLLIVSIDDGEQVRYVGTQATRAASTVGADLMRSGPRPAPPSTPGGVTRWIPLHPVSRITHSYAVGDHPVLRTGFA
jgi:hypothetical protein